MTTTTKKYRDQYAVVVHYPLQAEALRQLEAANAERRANGQVEEYPSECHEVDRSSSYTRAKKIAAEKSKSLDRGAYAAIIDLTTGSQINDQRGYGRSF